MKTLITALILMLAANTAEAMTGSDFVNATYDQQSNYTSGVVDGFSVAGFMSKIPLLFCIPTSVTNGQANKIILKFINSNPEKSHLSIELIIVDILMETFPCEAAKKVSTPKTKF